MRKIGFALPLLFMAGLSAQTSETLVYRALLSNTNEVPAVTNAATGTATVWLHVVRDSSGAVISGSADAYVNYQFGAASTITAMHIHTGGPTVSGAVVVPFNVARTDVTTDPGALPPVQTQFPSAAVTLDTIKGIIADPGQWYYNVHTTANAGGVMRGQLQRAEVVVRMAQLRPENENPALTAPWSGVGTSITLITRNQARAITSAYAIFDVKYTGFPDDTLFTGMHIHLGPTGVNGPVTIDSGLRGQVPVAASGTGTLHFEAEAVLTRAGALQSLEALTSNTNDIYYNVHTVLRPGGAMRGVVLRTDRTNFQVSLSGANENPPVTGITPASGSLELFTIRNPDSTVAAGVTIFDANVRMPAGTAVTATHIHDGAVGVNGPVTIDSALNGGPILLSDGTGNLYRMVTVATGAGLATLNDLMVNPEKHYWNIHSTANPGGVVRSQVAPAVTGLPTISSMLNGALAVTQAGVAPGGLLSLFGSNLAKVTGNTAGFNNYPSLPTALNGVSVTVGGVAAPLLYVAPDQINAQVPFGATNGQSIVVTGANGASTPVGAVSAAFAPAIFSDANGGLVFNAKTGARVSSSNPAAAGDSLLFLVTGLGQTSPALTSGLIVPRDVRFETDAVTVKIGGSPAAVISSRAVPGFAGVYQVMATLPSGLTGSTAKAQISAPFPALANFGAPNYSASNVVDVAIK